MTIDDVPDDIAEGEEATVDRDPLLGSVSCSSSPEKIKYEFLKMFIFGFLVYFYFWEMAGFELRELQ
jgi:hypothetical protein